MENIGAGDEKRYQDTMPECPEGGYGIEESSGGDFFAEQEKEADDRSGREDERYTHHDHRDGRMIARIQTEIEDASGEYPEDHQQYHERHEDFRIHREILEIEK